MFFCENFMCHATAALGYEPTRANHRKFREQLGCDKIKRHDLPAPNFISMLVIVVLPVKIRKLLAVGTNHR